LRIEPKPTTRAVIDVGRKCPINCRFCYYRHLGDLRKQSFNDVVSMKQNIDSAIRRGNNYIDVTGGEPLVYPDMPELIKYGLTKNVKMCVITSGIGGRVQIQKILDAGINDWLVSIHGMEKTHDYLTALKGAFKRQQEFMKQISFKMRFRFNFVINKFNQSEIMEVAQYMAKWRPTIVNFINMNLHHGWKHDVAARDVIANLISVQTPLSNAIEFLESNEIGVNVRYYPMCRIKEIYRRCICNDLHVVFDPFEWDYDIVPKTFDEFREWGIVETKKVEEKGSPCNECVLQWICGGANKHFHRVSTEVYGEVLVPIKNTAIRDKNDFYYYRNSNIRTLRK